MKRIIVLLFVMITAVAARAQIVTENVTYDDGGVLLLGYIAYDESIQNKKPAVIIVHDWMGIGEFAKEKAEAIAKLGYVGFAVDIYGIDSRPKNTQEAGKLAGTYKNDRNLMRKRINIAFDEIKKKNYVNPDRIAVMGYCFGGTVALELARSGADVKGTVSFHGGLDTPYPKDAKNIKGKVLVLHGGDDPFVPREQVSAFEKEMNDAGVDYQLFIYSGAVHSFTNPAAGNDNSKGAAYNEKADKRSWEAMKTFFKEIF
ncbi:MAG TPA: dienelactone hydrolase family protein [Ignavibacteria bacterium]|nr:dienelactone hydrolase family protein [Ignavibacteria bacterium]